MPLAVEGKANSSKLRLFVVDDEPDIAISLKIGLERHGFIVDIFTDPEDALHMFKPQTYDLLLIDINMPKLDGFKLFEKIQEKDSSANACFITAFETYFEVFRELFPDMDVGCYIRKPISPDDLARQVRLKVLHPAKSG